MAFAKIQDLLEEQNPGGGTITITLSGALTLGNGVVVMASYSSALGVITGIAAGSNTFVKDWDNTADNFGNSRYASSWICKNVVTASTALTVSFTNAVGGQVKHYTIEVSGQDTATQPDVLGNGAWQNGLGTTANQITSGTVTVANAGAAAIGYTDNVFGGGTPTAGTGFTQGDDETGVGTDRMAGEYQFGVSAGSKAATFTHSSGGGENVTGITVLRAASGGGGAANSGRMMLLGVGG